jgi:hypothetical protein
MLTEQASTPTGAVPRTAPPGAADEASVDRAAFIARLDPWRPPGRFLGRLDYGSAYFHSLLDLPRAQLSDTPETALMPAVATGLGGAIIGSVVSAQLAAACGLAVRSASFQWGLRAAVANGLAGGAEFVVGAGLLFVALWLVPRYVFLTGREQFRQRWELVYCETYMALCDTQLPALIADPEFWRQAFERARLSSMLKLVGLGPPQSPQEALRMAAAFWPYLKSYRAGDGEALARGFLDGYGAYAVAGASLTSWGAGEADLRARAAALVDFFLDPPEQLPPPASAPPQQPRSFEAARGYDYRLRLARQRTRG